MRPETNLAFGSNMEVTLSVREGIMDITWYGYSCFRLKGAESVVVTDPPGAEAGYQVGRLNAEIVTVSHNHPCHSNVAAVSGVRKVLTRPGEYEIANIIVTGIPTFHDSESGARLGRNTVFVIDVDGVRVCHLGDIGHIPKGDQLSELTNIDILLAPVGGGGSLAAAAAAQVINLIEPKIVVPMHYRTPACNRHELDGVERFLKELGLAAHEAQPRLSVTRQGLPKEKEATVVVLQHQL